ncbi:hypothetical protein Q1695_016396 [Nippostrongylus brasiliensis]|nr:hypothetical protein Q1695_016396 [Nippostrongylus brasiliensis]
MYCTQALILLSVFLLTRADLKTDSLNGCLRSEIFYYNADHDNELMEDVKNQIGLPMTGNDKVDSMVVKLGSKRYVAVHLNRWTANPPRNNYVGYEVNYNGANPRYDRIGRDRYEQLQRCTENDDVVFDYDN